MGWLSSTSLLGPLFFLLFINDITKFSSKFNCILFADDLTLYFDDNSTETLTNVCNSELINLYNWATANRLSINSHKTYFMTFTNRKVTIPPIKINNTNLVELAEGKFLGVLIGNKLKIYSHIVFFWKKTSKSLWIIYRLRKCLPQNKL